MVSSTQVKEIFRHQKYDPEFTDTTHTDKRLQNLRPVSRTEAYLCDITYGTNNEFGFDYLHDNMARSTEQLVQRGHHFAIVDEVDSILILTKPELRSSSRLQTQKLPTNILDFPKS